MDTPRDATPLVTPQRGHLDTDGEGDVCIRRGSRPRHLVGVVKNTTSKWHSMVGPWPSRNYPKKSGLTSRCKTTCGSSQVRKWSATAVPIRLATEMC